MVLFFRDIFGKLKEYRRILGTNTSPSQQKKKSLQRRKPSRNVIKSHFKLSTESSVATRLAVTSETEKQSWGIAGSTWSPDQHSKERRNSPNIHHHWKKEKQKGKINFYFIDFHLSSSALLFPLGVRSPFVLEVFLLFLCCCRSPLEVAAGSLTIVAISATVKTNEGEKH